MTDTLRRGDVLWRRVLDVGIAIRPRGRPQIVLAGTGVALWEAVAVERGDDELAELLAEQFDAPVDEVRDDLRDVIDALLEAGVLRRG